MVKVNLKEFFQEKGMSEETIKDSQKANENLVCSKKTDVNPSTPDIYFVR